MKDLSKNKIAYISGAKVVRGFFPKDNVERIELISIDEIEASAIGDFDMRNADELFLFYRAFRMLVYYSFSKHIRSKRNGLVTYIDYMFLAV